jgi:hypothetical protein
MHDAAVHRRAILRHVLAVPVFVGAASIGLAATAYANDWTRTPGGRQSL